MRYSGRIQWFEDRLKDPGVPWLARHYMVLVNFWIFLLVHSCPGRLALLVATEYKEMRDCVDLNLLSWQGKKASEAMLFAATLLVIVGTFLGIMTSMCCNRCCISTEESDNGGTVTVTKSNCWGRSKTWVSQRGTYDFEMMKWEKKEIVDSAYIQLLDLPLMVWAMVNSVYIMVKVDVPYKITYLGGLATFFVGEFSRLLCG
eukprot:TRINITY_DN3893_c0_g1_i2.p1 TRINITY_DN3893_c0_g1~~TRINITY_DN3893_c0_g1_i2.p1  ORF type:complete len:202 (-),score=25.54 TRINITY_DN3893_c0_g1_i2:76-681(-)